MAARPRMAAARSRARTPTKVDRSAAYAARYLAKNVVAAGLADRCTIQLSYAIGVAQPLSVYVDLHGTGKVDEAKLEDALRKVMDLSPPGIRKHLDLNKPIYAKTSAYGHFGRKAGRDGSFSWEKTDLVKALKDARRRLTTAPAMDDRRAAQPRDRSILRPPARQDHSAACRPTALEGLAALPARSRDAARRPISPRYSRRRFARSAWRSASAAASICCTRRGHPGDRLHRRRALRQRHGEADDGGSRSRRSPTRASMTTTPRACSTGCRMPRSIASTCSIPTPGRRRSTGSAVSSVRPISTVLPVC